MKTKITPLMGAFALLFCPMASSVYAGTCVGKGDFYMSVSRQHTAPMKKADFVVSYKAKKVSPEAFHVQKPPTEEVVKLPKSLVAPAPCQTQRPVIDGSITPPAAPTTPAVVRYQYHYQPVRQHYYPAGQYYQPMRPYHQPVRQHYYQPAQPYYYPAAPVRSTGGGCPGGVCPISR